MPVYANGISGPYLAARQASFLGDYDAAAHYYGRTLGIDATRPELLERAVLANISLGELETAADLALKITETGQSSDLGQMALVAQKARAADYAALSDMTTSKRGVGPLADGLVTAWAQLGLGNRKEALKEFGKVSQMQGLGQFAAYHKALALAVDGDFAAAEEVFETGAAGGMVNSRRGILARVEILSNLGRNEEAIKLIDDAFGVNLDPILTELRASLQADGPVPFTFVTSAQDGIAEVFYTLAGALAAEGNDDLTLLYARIAEHVRPDHIQANLLVAELLSDLEQYDLAVNSYARVPVDHPAFHVAEMGRAEALRAQDKLDEAISVMADLTKTHGDLPLVHATLGDLLRQKQDFEGAAASYTDALDLYEDITARQWFLYYSRAITYERQDQWDKAEADFRKALELNPDQPQVLNYLGYSLVQKKIKLDEALDMIERAVAKRPNSGYIVDSLGWALYGLGRYEEAVPHMERAAELMSIDPVVNDHLGDVYWSVGRTREAEFMWKRALSFIDWEEATEEVDGDRIRRKLEVGLDQVLADEGADPLHASND
jgi:tetratricopeptide (TPR) repeat protein